MPLCGDLLAGSGASVIKVESTQRPDGARRGAGAFYDLLNGHKRSVALDLQTSGGIRILRELVQRADVVIEASRPRALAQFGLDAHDAVAAGGPQVWLSITGYGRSDEGAHRIAFGDDAAAAGGLVTQRKNGPLFCADAIADPITGLYAAIGALASMATGGGHLVDTSLVASAAFAAGVGSCRGDHAVETSGSSWSVSHDGRTRAVEPSRPLGDAGYAIRGSGHGSD